MISYHPLGSEHSLTFSKNKAKINCLICTENEEDCRRGRFESRFRSTLLSLLRSKRDLGLARFETDRGEPRREPRHPLKAKRAALSRREPEGARELLATSAASLKNIEIPELGKNPLEREIRGWIHWPRTVTKPEMSIVRSVTRSESRSRQ